MTKPVIRVTLNWNPAPPRDYFKCAGLVLQMARAMWRQLTLRKNMLRGGWERESGANLLLRVHRAADHLDRAVSYGDSWPTLWAKAGDVANLAAMVVRQTDH